MYRFAVRRFSDHDRAVVNHAVANGSEVAVRWYEIYDPAGTVTLNQQGTFAPNATYRWMASMAEDQNKDIGLGYSASSSSIHPAIRFTGRVPSDPLGTMESEATILTGTGSQTPSANAGTAGATTPRWWLTLATIAPSGMWTNTSRSMAFSTGRRTLLRSTLTVARAPLSQASASRLRRVQ